MYGILIIAVLFDLWRIASKPSDPKDRKESIQSMATPDYIKVLLQDTTQFRVLKVIDGQPVYGGRCCRAKSIPGTLDSAQVK